MELHREVLPANQEDNVTAQTISRISSSQKVSRLFLLAVVIVVVS